MRKFAAISWKRNCPWVLYDLPASTALPENVPKDQELKSGARQGRNDFGKIGYGGPCPPPGPPHRYFFKLYALDAKLNLKAGVDGRKFQSDKYQKAGS